MRPPSRVDALRIEKVRMLWAYAEREVEAHKQRHLALLAASLSGAIASATATAIRTVGPALGSLLVAATLAGAGYAYLQLLRVPGMLRLGLKEQLLALDKMIYEEES